MKTRRGRRRTYHAPCQPTSQKGKAQKQDKPCLPSDPSTTIAKTIRLQPRLLNRIDHHHAHGGADAGNPVHEFHVYIGSVVRAVRVCCCVDQEEEADCKLPYLFSQSAKLLEGEKRAVDEWMQVIIPILLTCRHLLLAWRCC